MEVWQKSKVRLTSPCGAPLSPAALLIWDSDVKLSSWEVGVGCYQIGPFQFEVRGRGHTTIPNGTVSNQIEDQVLSKTNARGMITWAQSWSRGC